eukprot:jgi/Tetstr1/436556/TSEL_002710.t1
MATPSTDFSRLLNNMITPDGAVIHLQPYLGTTGLYGIQLLPIRDPSHGVMALPSPTASYYSLWRLRLGHRCARHMALTQQHAIGIPKLGPAPEAICLARIQAKSHQQSVNRQPSPTRDSAIRLAERSFRTIGECAQAMLLHDRTFWDWAYLHAVYLCNRRWSSSVNAIPYTLMTGRKPYLTHLHVSGWVAWVNIPVTMRAATGKMTPKSWPGIYVGHHEDSASYRIYNPATRRETMTRDVIFDEVTRPFSSTPALSMHVFQFPDDDHLPDEPQPSDQQEGPQALPPTPPSAALASAHEGPPPPHHNEQHLPRHREGDATSLPAPHFSGSAQLPSPYIDLSDYHPTLVASAIAEVVRP